MNTSAKIFSLQALREVKQVEQQDPLYKCRIETMDKVELLNEMVRFQEERSRLGELNVNLMVKGRILFRALEEHAETTALRSLTKSYRRHLEYELADYLSKSNAKAVGLNIELSEESEDENEEEIESKT